MSDIDLENLANEFDIEENRVEITKFREVLDNVKNIEDPYRVLTAIIEKASSFLDMLEEEAANGGGITGRQAEVASMLINNLTTAANSIATVTNMEYDIKLKQERIDQRNREIDQNDRKLDQKDKEIEIKDWVAKNQLTGSGKSDQNIIVTDRETILKHLNSGNQPKQVN